MGLYSGTFLSQNTYDVHIECNYSSSIPVFMTQAYLSGLGAHCSQEVALFANFTKASPLTRIPSHSSLELSAPTVSLS